MVWTSQAQPHYTGLPVVAMLVCLLSRICITMENWHNLRHNSYTLYNANHCNRKLMWFLCSELFVLFYFGLLCSGKFS